MVHLFRFFSSYFCVFSLGYGYPAISSPPFDVPTYNPPGVPPPVRLVSSTSTSITVRWDYPRENGGSPVVGFQLYVDDWAGGGPRLAFDGIDQPYVTSFVVSAATSFPLIANKGYRFMVRAVNYCFALDRQKACLGEFSEPAVFVARTARAPLAPPMPYRHAASNIGSQNPHDATIVVRWKTVVDNGGSEITSYTLYWAEPNTNSYKSIDLTNIPFINSANGDRVMEYSVSSLIEGNVYRFYVTASNKVGRSPASPILSVVAGAAAGTDYALNLVYSSVVPTVTSISASAITVGWPMPASQTTGGIPITGYKLYVYPGVGANTLASPRTVWSEVQVVRTSVNPRVSSIQQVFVDNRTINFYLSAYGIKGLSTLTFSSGPSDISNYLNTLFQTKFSNISATVSPWQTQGMYKTFTVDFKGYDGNFELLDVETTPSNAKLSKVVSVREGTSKINGSFTL